MDYWQKLRRALGDETLLLAAAAGAVVKDGKVLLVYSKTLEQWQFPGGFHELGETIQQTAQREIFEEVGLELKTGSLVSVYSGDKWRIEFANGDKVQQLLFFFEMTGEVSELTLQRDELSDYRFVGPDEVPENTLPCCKQKVADYFGFQGKPVFW